MVATMPGDDKGRKLGCDALRVDPPARRLRCGVGDRAVRRARVVYCTSGVWAWCGVSIFIPQFDGDSRFSYCMCRVGLEVGSVVCVTRSCEDAYFVQRCGGKVVGLCTRLSLVWFA